MQRKQVSTDHQDLKLEVVPIPVSDVERSKRFYEGLGWQLDGDFSGEGWRVVQMTPPGSPSSVHFGTGVSTAAPGSSQGAYLVVDDIEATRAELIRNGAEVTEPYHVERPGGPRLPGADPKHGPYTSYASFKDPDGNGWVIQEARTRLPGRGLSNDVPTLTSLLREAEERHGAYEKTAPKHHWSDWYGAYIIARERGKTPDEAAQDAALHMKNLPH